MNYWRSVLCKTFCKSNEGNNDLICKRNQKNLTIQDCHRKLSKGFHNNNIDDSNNNGDNDNKHLQTIIIIMIINNDNNILVRETRWQKNKRI